MEFGFWDGFVRVLLLSARDQGKGFPLPRPGLFWAAGFAFSSGEVVKEVPYETWHARRLVGLWQSPTVGSKTSEHTRLTLRILAWKTFSLVRCEVISPGVAVTAILTLCSL